MAALSLEPAADTDESLCRMWWRKAVLPTFRVGEFVNFENHTLDDALSCARNKALVTNNHACNFGVTACLPPKLRKPHVNQADNQNPTTDARQLQTAGPTVGFNIISI